MPTHRPSVMVIGAGLAGVFLSVLLAKRGYKVDLYERSSQQEALDYSSNRSFNITFYGYGVAALKDAGMWSTVESIMVPLQGCATQIAPHAKYIYSRFAFDNDSYYAVSRVNLLKALINVAKRSPLVTIHFNSEIEKIDRDRRTMTVRNSHSGTRKIIKCGVILGTDGVNSAVRTAIQRGPKVEHERECASWTYKQVAFSAALVTKLGMHQNTAYTWSRKSASIIGHPELDGSFGALLMTPKDSEYSFDALTSPEAVKQLIETHFPLLRPAVKTVTQAVLNNPESHFVSVRTSPWYYGDFMAILGDAAHGFFPFYGLGTSTAFGDCMEMVKLIDTYGPDWGRIFPAFQKKRKENTDIIGDMSKKSLKLFTRCSKADHDAIYERCESLLHRLFPRWCLPSLFYLVAREPNRSAEYKIKHDRQCRRFQYIGIGATVSALTMCVAFYEDVHALLLKPDAFSLLKKRVSLAMR